MDYEDSQISAVGARLLPAVEKNTEIFTKESNHTFETLSPITVLCALQEWASER